MNFYLLEDNPFEAAFLVSCLVQRGHSVDHFEHSSALIAALGTGRPHGLILDWMLPEVDGLVTLRRSRELCGAALPIIMLTSLETPEAIVGALESGADDYLVKPMVRSVLVARIEALMRRRVASVASIDSNRNALITSGPYRLDASAGTVHIGERLIALTPKEFDLAWMLFSNASRFISKAELIACVWGKRAEIGTRTITQHVHVLRTKLALRDQGFQLTAIYGSGYRLNPPDELEAAAVRMLPAERRTRAPAYPTQARRHDVSPA